MDVSFRRSVVFFSQITWGITQILLTETVEMLRRREIELVDNVRKRDIRHSQAIFDMFCPLLNQPLINGSSKLVLKYPAKSMHPVATQFR